MARNAAEKPLLGWSGMLGDGELAGRVKPDANGLCTIIASLGRAGRARSRDPDVIIMLCAKSQSSAQSRARLLFFELVPESSALPLMPVHR